jgi:CRISPR-associated protein Cas5d
MNDRLVSVRVKGDFALFTRPENKVERVSYPIITPSAARGVLEAIYWHPEFAWAIREIRVLAPVQTFGIFRNEVNSKMSPSRSEPYFADEDRSQRFSVCLRDVDYVICAEPIVKPATGEHQQKFRDIFERRVKRGQCFHRPALGCREFAADFGPADDAPEPVDWNEDLGLMLHDMDYSPGKPPYRPRFFEARVERGVMRVPALAEVRR